MAQNTSSAVMQQRIEPHDSLDFFITPPWATRALCLALASDWQIGGQTCWEPACGDGAMARPLGEFFENVFASDIHSYDPDHAQRDFLFPGAAAGQFDWIITNPPFRLAADFALKGIELARIGCAMLVRLAFLEGRARYERLFAKHKPIVLQFAERVPIFKGRLDPEGSSATAYCWLVWPAGRPYTTWSYGEIRWIPPCRRRLEQPGDYDG